MTTLQDLTPLRYACGFTEGNTLGLRKMIDRVRCGMGRGKLAIVGDSTSVAGGAGTGTGQYTGARPYGWPVKLAAYLQSRGVGALGDHLFTSHNFANNAVAINNFDSRVVPGPDWFASSSLGNANSSFHSIINGAVFAYAPAQVIDTIEIYYARNTTLGSVDVNLDGVTVLGTINAAGAGAVMKQVYSGLALGTHTINIVKNGTASFHLLGIVAYNSAASEIDIINWSAQSGNTSDFLITTGGYSASATPAALAADHAIIMLTTNDAEGGTLATAGYESRLAGVVNNFQAAGTGTTVATGWPASTTKGLSGVYDAHFAAARRVAAATGSGLVDFAAYCGDYSTANARGRMADSRHGNRPGYHDKACFVGEVVLSI